MSSVELSCQGPASLFATSAEVCADFAVLVVRSMLVAFLGAGTARCFTGGEYGFGDVSVECGAPCDDLRGAGAHVGATEVGGYTGGESVD